MKKSILYIFVFMLAVASISVLSLGCSKDGIEKRDPMYIVYKNNKCGYINNKGEILINPQFDVCNNFYGNRAVISIGSVMGIIDNDGKIVITPKYWVMSGYHKYYTKFDYSRYTRMMYYPAEFSDFRNSHLLAGEPKGVRGKLAQDAYFYGISLNGITREIGYISDYFGYSNGYYLVRRRSLYYFMGVHGKDYKLKKEYDITTGFEDAIKFSEGLAAVRFEGKWGFVDASKGDAVFIINPQFEKAYSFSDGLAAVKVGGKWGYVDNSGQFIINPQFDEAFAFNEGVARVKSASEKKYGFINRRGKYIVSPLYDEASWFVEGLAAVKKGGKWGYIDNSGAWVIQPEYDVALNFSEGFAAVGKYIPVADTKKETLKYGFIDKTGNQIINFEYNAVGDFFNGIALVSLFSNKKNEIPMFGYKDSKNKWIWELSR
ncbi:MAG TPA: WG repeat-containing protein [Spirochaetota bacterium]|nr:WG repeat-containing protein [Spirochaetota bacterium]